jgi:hypothetical protein
MSTLSLQPGPSDDSSGSDSLTWVKNWMWFFLGGCVAIALLAAAVTAMLYVLSEQKQLEAVRGRTEQRLAEIDYRVANLGWGLGHMIADRAAARSDFSFRFLEMINESLRKASANENPVLAMKTATAVVRKAREKGIHADPQDLADSGLGFLRLVDDYTPSPGATGAPGEQLSEPAIETVSELIGYRSALLRTPLDLGAGETAVAQSAMQKLSRLHAFSALDNNARIYGSTQTISGSDARMNLLDKSVSNPGENYRSLLVDGYDVKLDGLDLRNVVFRNSRIGYEGGPILLDTVFFSNCTFQITPQGRDLANVVLTNASGQVSLTK